MNTCRKIFKKNFRVGFHNVEQKAHFLFILICSIYSFVFISSLYDEEVYNDINFFLQVLLFGMIFVAMIYVKAQV